MFEREFPQPHSNFKQDSQLSNAEKSRFVKHLASYTSGPYMDYVNGFLHDAANQQIGSEAKLLNNEIAGTVRSLSAFASRFTQRDILDHDPLNAEVLIRDLSLLPSSHLIASLNALFPSAATTARSLMWSYRNTDPADPFAGIEINDLPCRLALPSYAASEHVAFGHYVSAENRPCVPTFFDAGLSNEWRPGGKTHPLPPCKPKYSEGLPEVVHRPTLFRDISTELHIL